MISRFVNRRGDSVQQLQLALLQKQLAYCYQNVVFYKDCFDTANFDVHSVHSLEQLQQLPLLDKATVRAAQANFRGVGFTGPGMHKSFSSGSTGEPFASYFDKLSWYRKKYLIKLRARFACGMHFRQRVAILECEDAETVARRNSNSWLTDAVLPVRVFSLFQDKAELIQQLRDYAPVNIYAYASHLFELADADASEPPILPSVRRLFTSSEFLESGTRQFIEERFAAPIYDHYGSTEFKEIAWQCREKDWYHINYDEVICEVLDEQGKPVTNQPGHIVVTDLRNKAMPLIRFKLGDIGIMSEEPCSCGFAGNSIKPLGGRASDYIELPSGERLSAFRFTTEIEYLAGLRKYQIVQQSSDLIEVATVWDAAPADEKLSEVKSIMLRALRAGGLRDEDRIKVVAIAVESIANEENGKFKVVKRAF